MYGFAAYYISRLEVETTFSIPNVHVMIRPPEKLFNKLKLYYTKLWLWFTKQAEATPSFIVKRLIKKNYVIIIGHGMI